MNASRFLLLAALACAGCADRSSSSGAGGTQRSNETTSESAPSLYDMGLPLEDQNGAAIHIDAFRGHPVVISMFYGSCVSACPLIVSHVKQIEAALSPEARADTRVLLVSFDPEHDTPPVLASLAAQHEVDRSRWTFARGSENDVRMLAAALNVTYRKLPQGGFSHTSVITVLDKDGRPVARADDPAADLAPVVQAAETAAK